MKNTQLNKPTTNMKTDYEKFLEQKRHSIGDFGFEANYLPDIAFDFTCIIEIVLLYLQANK